ncbi:tyrosine-type recombinase/integrase [bacterium]|nr:tyrosine-type recombinase/integrase [bacterium]
MLRRLGLPGHLHTFRHAFIAHALLTGVPEAVVRGIIGHVDEKIIRPYTHIADQRSLEAIRSLQRQSDGPFASTEADEAGRDPNTPADSRDSETNDEDVSNSAA